MSIYGGPIHDGECFMCGAWRPLLSCALCQLQGFRMLVCEACRPAHRNLQGRTDPAHRPVLEAEA